MILWSAGIILALGLAWFVGAVVVPVWQVHRALASNSEPAEVVAALGGPERAFRRLRLYWRMSKQAAPDTVLLLRSMDQCGEQWGPEVVEVLIAALRDSDSEVRARAAILLAPRKAPCAIMPLSAALHDDDERVREEAARALALTGDPSVLGLLLSAFGDAGYPAAVAYVSVAKQEQPDPQPPLEALRDPDARVRRMAAYVIGELHATSALDDLSGALRDADPGVRATAARALGELRDLKAREPLVAAMQDSAKDVRRAAVYALADLRDGRAVEPLVALLSDSDINVRLHAATMLGDVRDARSFDGLVAALKDQNMYVRCEVARALGYLGDRRALAPLIKALNDECDWARGFFCSALKDLTGDEAAKAVQTVIDDVKQSPDVRAAAAEALEKIRAAMPKEPEP